VQILRDLIAATPGEEGRWFAAAKEAGQLELAGELANQSPCDPKTLCQISREIPPSVSFETPPSGLFQCVLGEREGENSPSPLRVKANNDHEGGGGGSNFGLSRPALSFSLSLKLSPLMLIVIE
jgi:hypothetical protein